MEASLSVRLKLFPNAVKSFIRRMTFTKFIFGVLLAALLIFTAFPLVAMINRAFMPLEELFIYPPRIIVRRPTMKNFTDLLTSLSASTVPFTRYIFNSVWITLVSVSLSVVVSCLGAYGLVKHKPYGANALFAIVLAGLMFSGHVTQIPNYMIVSGMGLMNSYSALIIPKIAVAYNFFLVKQFCEQLPDSLLEAARIDGANELTVFFKIALPLLKPAWSTLAVFSFVSNWNDSFSPLVYITSVQMKTLPLALQTLAGGAGVVSRSGAVGAASLLTTLPTIIVYTVMRGRVMQTMTYSGIKS
ncbi:MAG: carbohydrate ABC transporter permease [Lachnospiraceae bacterium]